MRFSAVKKLYVFLLILLCGLTVLTAEETWTETENPFLADDFDFYNSTDIYTVALNDDDLFGGSDDDLFGGSDDDLFGGSDDDLFGGSDDDLFVGSDNDLFGGSDDDLFGGSDDMFDSMIEEVDAPTAEAPSAVDASAIYDKGSFRAGGSFSIGMDSLFTWYEPFKDGNRNPKFIRKGFKDVALSPVIKADFYLDSRPSDIFRFYTKIKFKVPQTVFYPFSDDLEHQYSDEKIEGSFFEYFVDYNLHDRFFFRLGKHTVTWGVGYFFSPADVINLSAVDPENPTEQREGAISLRTQVVFPGTQNCLWLYVLPDIDEKKGLNDFDIKYTAFAGKFEFLINRFEIGIGGWYKYGRTPRAVGTVTGAFRKLSLFSELVLGYGTEEQWSPLGKNGSGNVNYGDMKAVFQGTAGFMYTWKDPKLTLIGQYFFNGFGDKKTMDLSIMDFVKLKNAYNYAGRHYLALSLSKQELFTSDCSGSLYGMLSLTDGSGMAQGTFSAKFWDDFTLSTGPIAVFGKKGSEFTRMGGFSGGGSFSWKLSLTYAPDKF